VRGGGKQKAYGAGVLMLLRSRKKARVVRWAKGAGTVDTGEKVFVDGGEDSRCERLIRT